MAGDWERKTVSELQAGGALLVEDGNHGEQRPRPHEFSTRGIQFIRAADMDGGRVLFESAQRINEVARHRIRKGIGAGGDVLLSHKGTVGKVAYVPLDAPPFVCSPQTTFWRVKDERRLDRRYIYFFLRSRNFREQLDSRKGETDMADYVSLTAQRTFMVTVPPLAEQKAIAGVLGTLDDKIDLNRRMNATLEAMAGALFQSWFVDFAPVRAKFDGRQPPGLDKATAAVFHPKFQDSPVGQIPKGWETVPLYNTAKFINGAAFTSEDFCEAGAGLPVVKITELKDGLTAQTKWSQRQAEPDQLIDTGDLLYSWSGSPDTSLDAFLWANGRGLLNQHIFKVVAPSTAQKRYVYYLLKYLRPVLVEIARNKQTTGLGHVTVADMKRLLVCWPTAEILAAFDQIIGRIFDRAFANTLESRSLATLRDALLPRLLSGELSLKELLPS